MKEQSLKLTTDLASLRRSSGSTSLTSQASVIDHLLILKYSQHFHNNKNIGDLFSLYLYYWKSFIETSGL